jgi:Toprim-like
VANQKMKISELADQVRNIPLHEVLERYGFEAKPEGTTLRAKSEHHNIVVTDSRWFDNKAGVGGGGAIDLVIHIAKVDFSAACRSLADQFRPLATSQTTLSFPKSSRQLPHQEKKSFEELAAIYAVRDDTKWPIARAYLVEKRKIGADLVDGLHQAGAIFANNHSPNPSLAFLHRDCRGIVRGATLRDTKHQSAFRPCLGNKLTAWFALGDITKASRIAAVESPIDALSYFCLHGRPEDLAVVSCAGAMVPHELLAQAYDRRQSFIVALDNDIAGEQGWLKAWDTTADWTGFQISPNCPEHKDWNDDLVQLASSNLRHAASLKL